MYRGVELNVQRGGVICTEGWSLVSRGVELGGQRGGARGPEGWS